MNTPIMIITVARDAPWARGLRGYFNRCTVQSHPVAGFPNFLTSTPSRWTVTFNKLNFFKLKLLNLLSKLKYGSLEDDPPASRCQI